ncbi:MAG TPA: MBL fold metallo-hydrolase [Usitatibacteraceae bacterium]|nr:MBL fold metallo-hydrolase [Usitatibacteraceae bacterium]
MQGEGAILRVLNYPFDPPEPGELREIADGVHWIRMPLPFKPDHINLWLLRDEFDGAPGWTVVDTGFAAEATRDLWLKLLDGAMGRLPVGRIVVTHFHPDHVGCARWLAERTGATVWMTLGEFLSAHASASDTAGFDRANSMHHFLQHGLHLLFPEANKASLRESSGERKEPPVPKSFQRMFHRGTLVIGGRDWQVITAFGHAPEHATLYTANGEILIAGDQILPTITPNISVWGNQPEANPLQLYINGLAQFDGLPEDTLVLPSHGKVFRGLAARLAALRVHHAQQLETVLAALATPKCAGEIVGVLFPRKLDEMQRVLAMGETIAHLNLLWQGGSVLRIRGEDGLWRFRRV